MTRHLRRWIVGCCLFAAATLGTLIVQAGPPAHAPAVIELPDQFDTTQQLSFPTTNVTVLTICDKKGQDQVDAWVDALKGRYHGEVDLRGMADTSNTPGVPRWLVRRQIREKRKYPVMLDWSGTVCAQLGFAPGVVNVLVLDYDGLILGHVTGAAVETNTTTVFEVVDRALKSQSK